MDKALAKLDRIFSAQDIMTPVPILERADRLEDAIPLFKEYDVVPYPKKGRIDEKGSSLLLTQIICCTGYPDVY